MPNRKESRLMSSHLTEEVEDLLFELKVSPAVFSLAVLIMACEHKHIHEAARYLDEPDSLDYYGTAGLRYLPMTYRAILNPVATDLRCSPEQLAAPVLSWFVQQRQYLGGFDVWIQDALKLTGDKYLVNEVRCQGCRKIVPAASRKQRYCSTTCEYPPAEPVLSTHGF
jgi:hypothetical protein